MFIFAIVKSTLYNEGQNWLVFVDARGNWNGKPRPKRPGYVVSYDISMACLNRRCESHECPEGRIPWSRSSRLLTMVNARCNEPQVRIIRCCTRVSGRPQKGASVIDNQGISWLVSSPSARSAPFVFLSASYWRLAQSKVELHTLSPSLDLAKLVA